MMFFNLIHLNRFNAKKRKKANSSFYVSRRILTLIFTSLSTYYERLLSFLGYLVNMYVSNTTSASLEERTSKMSHNWKYNSLTKYSVVVSLTATPGFSPR